MSVQYSFFVQLTVDRAVAHAIAPFFYPLTNR